MSSDRVPNIVILGGGYGGLQCAMRLQKKLPSGRANVTLVSKHDYHYQTTLLHKVAAGTLATRKARIFYRKVLDTNKISFIKDSVLAIDPENRVVECDRHKLSYDYLVIGLGFRSKTMNVPGVDDYAYSIISLNTAQHLAHVIENKFKDFAITQNSDDLRVIVCGSGLTGIEFAAEIASQLDDLCCVCGIDRSLAHVTCIGGSRFLPGFSDSAVRKAKKKLVKAGVEIVTGARVTECHRDGVTLKDKDTGAVRELKGTTVVWCGGVQGSEVVEQSPFENKQGRIAVDEHLRVPGVENIFVVGDCSQVTDENGKPYPATAQIANQAGAYVGDALIALIQGRSLPKRFKYAYKGTLCGITHTDGVAMVMSRAVSGELAAFIKNFVENRWLFNIGGLRMVIRKGQFRFRTSN